MTVTTPAVLDLDAARADRERARAAASEGRSAILPVQLGGEVIATLPAECPVDVFQPLTELNVDLAFIIKAVTNAVTAKDDAEQRIAAMNLLVNVLAAHPDLPAGILAAVKDITRRVLGDEGYGKLAAARPSREDLAFLATGILTWWGVSLGEFLPSPASPEVNGGATSKQTSSGTTSSTRGASGKSRARRGSSAPAVS